MEISSAHTLRINVAPSWVTQYSGWRISFSFGQCLKLLRCCNAHSFGGLTGACFRFFVKAQWKGIVCHDTGLMQEVRILLALIHKGIYLAAATRIEEDLIIMQRNGELSFAVNPYFCVHNVYAFLEGKVGVSERGESNLWKQKIRHEKTRSENAKRRALELKRENHFLHIKLSCCLHSHVRSPILQF